MFNKRKIQKFRFFKQPLGPRIEITHNFAADLIQRELLLDSADIKSDHRHTVNDTAFLILPDRIGARLAHFQKPLGAICAHPCQDNAHRIASRCLGDGVEKHVDSRAEPPDFFAALALDIVAACIRS